MSVETKTWPYGTTRFGKVESITLVNGWHFVKDDQDEGHILTGGARDASVKVGDKGTLTFTKGGPTGGYWKFVKFKCQVCCDTGIDQTEQEEGRLKGYTCECEKGIELMNRYDMENADRKDTKQE